MGKTAVDMDRLMNQAFYEKKYQESKLFDFSQD